jgi:hypothetical protein
MTCYVINRFASVELPTFNPDWRALCDRCVYHVAAGPRETKLKAGCVSATKGIGGRCQPCSEVRHTACANGELFRERVA